MGDAPDRADGRHPVAWGISVAHRMDPTRVVWCSLVLTLTASFKVGDDEAIVVCVWSAGSLPKAVDNVDWL